MVDPRNAPGGNNPGTSGKPGTGTERDKQQGGMGKDSGQTENPRGGDQGFGGSERDRSTTKQPGSQPGVQPDKNR